jgi:hypothetical protein
MKLKKSIYHQSKYNILFKIKKINKILNNITNLIKTNSYDDQKHKNK